MRKGIYKTTAALSNNNPLQEEEMDTYTFIPTVCYKNLDANFIYERIGYALKHQRKFTKITTPWEMKKASSLWTDKEELMKFKINISEIDRVYYISDKLSAQLKKLGGINGLLEFKLICRMKYNKKSYVFVELNARCVIGELLNYKDDDICGSGTIFVSKDANQFVDNISCIRKEGEEEDFIRQSIVNDDFNNSFAFDASVIGIGTTHKNFKSIDPKIRNIDDIDTNTRNALANQHTFYLDATIEEGRNSFLLNEKVQKNFHVNLEEIDRLYYIDHDEINDKFEWIFRIDYIYGYSRHSPVFVHMWGWYGSRGHMIVSTDGDLFMNYISKSNFQKKNLLPLFRQALTDDVMCMDVRYDAMCMDILNLYISYKTHENFKSIYFPDIYNNAKIIDTCVGRALDHQNALKKGIKQRGKTLTEPLKESLEINVSNIDRLYYMHHFSNKNTIYDNEEGLETFRLLCRMEYDNYDHENSSLSPYFFVELIARYYDYKVFDDSMKWTGVTNVYLDVEHFMTTISKDQYYKYHLDPIRQSLIEDDYNIG